MGDQLEIATEQAYFDTAWDCRETARSAAVDGANLKVWPRNRADAKALAAQNNAYLENLAPAETAVAWGAIALDDGEVLYVGLNTIFAPDKDALVINWRSKVGELYERATASDPLGVARKRTFRTKRNTILDFEDAHFADLLERISELEEWQQQGTGDVLLKDLEAGRTGEMRDIVRTIQAAQSELIRHPADALLRIQGGPGTGKSAIALHRISWLLFNDDGLRADRVLVIGPSETFTSYIKSVLPGLGDVGVPQISLRRLGPIGSTRRDETVETARLKGDERMAGLIERALHLRVRLAGQEPTLRVAHGNGEVGIPRAEIEDRIERLRHLQTYDAGRSAMRTWLAERAQELVTNAGRRGRVDNSAVDAALNRVWPSLSAAQFLRDLLGSNARLLEAAGRWFTADELQILYRQATDSMAAETWSDSDVALLDEVEVRLKGTPDRYDHIVVDEAQDLSPMQLRSISRRSANGRYTVVGDIAQSTGAWARNSWDDVEIGLLQNAPLVQRDLEYGYRVPKEIYEIAAKLLPIIAPDLEPLSVVRSAPETPRFILDNGDLDLTEELIEAVEEHTKKGRFVGVIVAPSRKAETAAALSSADITFTDADAGGLGASVNLISATEAKGLEFDAAVVIEPAEIAEVDGTGRLLYIALTRATKYLTVVHALAYPPLELPGVERAPAPEPSFMQQIFDGPTSAGQRPPETAPAGGAPTYASLSNVLRGSVDALVAQIKEDVPEAKWELVAAAITETLASP